jgi:SAM-dependent methyltransferase
MNLRKFVRRNRWVFVFVVVAALAWWAAFNYLIDFRDPDVPFVTTPNDVVSAMLDLAEVSEADTLYDLGSGDGRVLIAAGRRGAKAVGIEIDPALVRQSREAVRAAGLADRVSVRRGDIFREDLTPATVITLYLMPDVNARLRPQLDRLRPGTRVVSHMYRIPGAKSAKRVEVQSAEDGVGHPLYRWVTPIEWE